jgi:hypothetical protein
MVTTGVNSGILQKEKYQPLSGSGGGGVDFRNAMYVVQSVVGCGAGPKGVDQPPPRGPPQPARSPQPPRHSRPPRGR